METKKKLTRQQNIIAMAQRLNVAGKHAGSKPIKSLLNGIRSVQESSRIIQAAALKRAKLQPKAPEKLEVIHDAEETTTQPVAVVEETAENVDETAAQ